MVMTMKTLNIQDGALGETKEIYPLTIIYDRYGGTYSGGAYTAWNCNPYDIPNGPFSSDCECSDFWCKCKIPVGKGRTPDEAIADLWNKLTKGENVPSSSRAEQVRSMTNEELADFVRMIHGNGVKGLHPDCSWLEWLERKTEIWPKIE